jgi:Lysylphosphatidylglycerol synthase TM region
MSARGFGWRELAYVLILAIAAALTTMWWAELAKIWQAQGLTLVIAAIFMILALVVQTRNFIIFLGEPVLLRTWSLSRIWAITALANYLGPLQPGVALRVAYLSRRGVKISSSLLATWRQVCVSIWMALGGLTIGLWLTGEPKMRWPAAVLLMIFLGLAVLRHGLIALLEKIERPAWFVQHKHLLSSAISGITMRGIVGVMLQYVIGTLLLMWVYRRFGADILWGQALVLACMVYASSLVAVMPGNLGVMDGIYMIGGHGLGLTVAESAALALLLRGAHISGCALLVLAGGFSSDKDGMSKQTG